MKYSFVANKKVNHREMLSCRKIPTSQLQELSFVKSCSDYVKLCDILTIMVAEVRKKNTLTEYNVQNCFTKSNRVNVLYGNKSTVHTRKCPNRCLLPAFAFDRDSRHPV